MVCLQPINCLTPLQAVRQTFESLGNVEAYEEIVKLILTTSENGVTNVADLLNRNPKPDVAEVLDVFNAGLKFNILTLNESYVEVNSDAFEKLLSNNAKALVEAMYPDDFFQQLLDFGLFQKKIGQVNQKFRTQIAKKKIPISSFAAVLSAQRHSIARRDASGIQERDLFSDWWADVQSLVCESLVGAIYRQFNVVVTKYVNYLEGIDVVASDSLVAEVLAKFISSSVTVVVETIEYANKLIAIRSANICYEILSNSTSRRRRDLPAIDAEQAVVTEVILDNFWRLTWSMLEPELTVLFFSVGENAVDALRVEIDSYLTEDITPSINIVFPSY